MQWFINIIKEWVLAQDYPSTALMMARIEWAPKFFDRGDPAAYDFTTVDFTADSAWHELDLSGIVPAGPKGVCINIHAVNIAISKRAWFRRHGNVNNKNCSCIAAQVANNIIAFDIVVPVSTDRKIDYLLQEGLWTTFDFIVKGWWF